MSLVLKPTEVPGPDYEVYDAERRIGRITLISAIADEDRPWFWTITARWRTPSLSDCGYAASREQATADFKAAWERNDKSGQLG